MICGACDKTDGMCYCSLPPQVKCIITGRFHYYDEQCDVKSNDICPICGGNLELWADGYEHCDSCDQNTKEKQ